MSTYFRPQSQSFALFVCLIAIALLHRASQPQTEPEPYPPQNQQVQRRQIQAKALEGTVSGSIGIDHSRGDSVYVVVRN